MTFIYLPDRITKIDGVVGDSLGLVSIDTFNPRCARDRRGPHRHRPGGRDPAAHRLLHRDQPQAGRRRRQDARSPARPPSSSPASRSASSRRSTPRSSSAPRVFARVPARRRLGRRCRCSPSRSPAPACSPRSASSSRWTPSARSRTTRRASRRCPATSPRRARRSSPTSTPSATPPRRSPRASRSRRPSSPRPRCSARSATPSCRRPRPRSPRAGSSYPTRSTRLQYSAVLDVANPRNLVGLIIGAAVVFLFSGLAINAVSRAAGAVIFEVRRQFRDHPGIMDGTEKPEYGKVVDIVTRDSLRELVTPGLLAVLTPIAVGFGLGVGAARRLPRRHHRDRRPHGRVPVELRWGVGQREEVRRGRQLTAARAPRRTRPPSSATPSATRSRTPPARRSTR